MTLSDVPGRRMSDDYKLLQHGSVSSRPYEPSRGTVEGPSWIADAVRKKVEASYAGDANLNLLVYANFPSDRLDYKSMCASIREFSGRFASIWVVTNHQICSVTSYPGLGYIPDLRLIEATIG
jgi:hypothetical protein